VVQLFKRPTVRESDHLIFYVLLDFIEGEFLNLKTEKAILEALKGPDYRGYYFQTTYNSRDGSRHALEDMPYAEMKEAVLGEYDRKLDPSGMRGDSKEAKRATWSKSRFVDHSLLAVATIAAYRRKKVSVILSRDRWIKLSCQALKEKFKMPIYCYDQYTFSIEEILTAVSLSKKLSTL
jgi:hypothetical protein